MILSCPACSSSYVIKKGKRKTKQGTEQRYLCKTCHKTFVHRGFKNKTYPAEVILEAVNLYHRGYTLKETKNTINKKFKSHTTQSSVQRWIQEYKDLCTYHTLRIIQMKQYGKDIIVSKDFIYNGLAYNFKYHKGKLDVLGKKYPVLVSYIKRFESGCPSFFDSIKNRCSKLRIEIIVEKTHCDAPICKLVSLALNVPSTKRGRHSIVESFLLINDDSTIAVEVPVWLWEKNLALSIAGHIDLIQIAHGYVYILDYKPDTAKENENAVASQLYLYALGLSFRTGIPLKMMRCAWFDEHDYFEFEPKKAIVKYPTKPENSYDGNQQKK